MHPITLERKIRAKNLLAKKLNEILPAIFESVKTMEGKNVIVADNNYSKALRKAIGTLPNSGEFMAYVKSSKYALRIGARANVWGDGYNVSAEDSVTIGVIDGGVLQPLEQFTPLKTNWILSEVQDIHSQIEQAAVSISRLQALIPLEFRE